jgi:hypothetical protein
MKVRCIDATGGTFNELIEGRIYEVEDTSSAGRMYYLRGVIHAWYYTRFVPVGELQPGWKYCRCGTATTNADMCCDCRTL